MPLQRGPRAVRRRAADDLECEARVVTELKDTVNNASLPDRFMMAMRAMRGEFSPSSGDTERDDGQILEAMVDFPADIDAQGGAGASRCRRRSSTRGSTA